MKYLYIEKRQRVDIKGEWPKRALRMIQEFNRLGLQHDVIYLDDIVVGQPNSTDSPTPIKLPTGEISQYSHIIFGGHNSSNPLEYETKRAIAKEIKRYNRRDNSPKIHLQNIDFILLLEKYDKSHMADICIKNGLPHLPTYFDPQGNYIGKESLVGGYPYIAKINSGVNDLISKGEKEIVKKNVFLINKPEDWQQERLKDMSPGQFIIQQFSPEKTDYRFFVSKGRVVGGWKREADDSSFMTVGKGSIYTLVNTPPTDIAEICQVASEKWHVDFMALDFIYFKDKSYILEFSMHPGFAAYETKCLPGNDHSSQTPENIAKVIIDSF